MRFVVQVEGTSKQGGQTSTGAGCRVFTRLKDAEEFYLFTMLRIAGGEEVLVKSAARVVLQQCRLLQVDAHDEQSAREQILARKAKLLKGDEQPSEQINEAARKQSPQIAKVKTAQSKSAVHANVASPPRAKPTKRVAVAS